MTTFNVLEFQSVKLNDEDQLIILDQTKLPNETVYRHLACASDVWDAIYKLEVRGAPAIGIAGAYGLYIAAVAIEATSVDGFMAALEKAKIYLDSARPTAVNLHWALERMTKRAQAEADGLQRDADIERDALQAIAQIRRALRHEAHLIRDEDEAVCKAIGQYSLSLLKPGMGLLTHCNAGTIATAKYGTALAPIYLGHERGYDFKVFADETRPLLQGARLTAWELNAAGVDVTVIADNMASIVMKNGWVEAVLVGCDRVALNGDTANKIGTSGVAILAKHYGIPFYVHAPLSTIDLATLSGGDIHIELRPGTEITDSWYTRPMAPEGVKTYNPSFDVTDHSLITAIITEKGIAYPPYYETIPALFSKD